MGNHWTLQDARNKFSAVVEAARSGKPQQVIRRGVDAVVVLSAKEHARLAGLDKKPAKTFVEHLLDAPKLPEGCDNIFDDRHQYPSTPRDIDFD